MDKPIKWAAQLANVREVSLRGKADLAFWTEWLAPQGLVPAELDGHAQLLVIAVDSAYLGIPFRELSFSVTIDPPQSNQGQVTAYLVQAFNSVRFFAFCERVLFATPYLYGAPRVFVAGRAGIELWYRNEIVFEVQMDVDDRLPRQSVTSGPQPWEATVYIPRRPSKPLKQFRARIHGDAWNVPFCPSRDSMNIATASRVPICRALLDSEFTVQQWTVRQDASHAKSKTYSVAQEQHAGRIRNS